jgi:cobalt-precorrin 5A hydrolase
MIKHYPIAVWTLNEKGLKTALRFRSLEGIKDIFTSNTLKSSYDNPRITGYDKFSDSVSENFSKYKAHVFIMATGVVIRTIAGLIKDKTTDPAIVVLDEMGKNVISLLSGHLGGANTITMQLATFLGGNPVITTATDINNIIAVDTIAMEIGAKVENKEMIKIVSSAMLNNEPVAFISDITLFNRYYGDADYRPNFFRNIVDVNPNEYSAICIVSEKQFSIPPDVLKKVLMIRPPNIVLGIGCNSNTTRDEIASTVDRILEQKAISPLSIAGVATIDKKKDEPGLLEYCESIGCEFKYYSSEELNSVEYMGMSKASENVFKHVGAYGVSEPAALLYAGKGAGLIMNKIKSGNMTLAIARKKLDYLYVKQ